MLLQSGEFLERGFYVSDAIRSAIRATSGIVISCGLCHDHSGSFRNEASKPRHSFAFISGFLNGGRRLFDLAN